MAAQCNDGQRQQGEQRADGVAQWCCRRAQRPQRQQPGAQARVVARRRLQRVQAEQQMRRQQCGLGVRHPGQARLGRKGRHGQHAGGPALPAAWPLRAGLQRGAGTDEGQRPGAGQGQRARPRLAGGEQNAERQQAGQQRRHQAGEQREAGDLAPVGKPARQRKAAQQGAVQHAGQHRQRQRTQQRGGSEQIQPAEAGVEQHGNEEFGRWCRRSGLRHAQHGRQSAGRQRPGCGQAAAEPCQPAEADSAQPAPLVTLPDAARAGRQRGRGRLIDDQARRGAGLRRVAADAGVQVHGSAEPGRAGRCAARQRRAGEAGWRSGNLAALPRWRTRAKLRGERFGQHDERHAAEFRRRVREKRKGPSRRWP